MIEVLMVNTEYTMNGINPFIMGSYDDTLHLTFYDNYTPKLEKILASGDYDIVVTSDNPTGDKFANILAVKRTGRGIPVIHIPIESQKEYEKDVIKAFKLGVDDYLKIPFGYQELVARICTIVNRYRFRESINNVKFSNFNLNLVNRNLTYRDTNRILTSQEAFIVEILFKNANRVVRFKDIQSQLWGVSNYYSGNCMRVLINRVRSILEVNPMVNLETVRGKGYRIVDITDN